MKRHLMFFAVLFVLLLAACSPAAPTAAPAMPATPKESAAQGKPATGQVSYPAGAQPQAQPTAAVAQSAAATAAPAGQGEQPQTTSPLAYSPAGSMVIKDAQVDLLVRDASQALTQLTALTGQESGYIISSQTWYQDGYMYASVRIGIPSAHFEEALNQIRRIGMQVLRENAQGQDVTNEYVDMQSRLTNLEATSARVREFLKNAKTIEESLRINQQLADLEQQIEQVKGQMNYVEGRVAYSTVTVTLTPEYPTPTPTVTPTMTPTPTATPPWNPGKTVDKASGLLAVQFQGFVDALLWIGIVVVPWMLLLALGLLVVRGIVKKTMPKSR